MSSFNPDSWRRAEEGLLTILCDVTGHVAGKTAFLGSLPPVLDVWAMDTGGLIETPAVWVGEGEITNFRIAGLIEGQFRKRADAQRMMMTILGRGEIRTPDECPELCLARVAEGGPFEVKLVDVPIANNETLPMFVVRIGIELDINTRTGADVD